MTQCLQSRKGIVPDGIPCYRQDSPTPTMAILEWRHHVALDSIVNISTKLSRQQKSWPRDAWAVLIGEVDV